MLPLDMFLSETDRDYTSSQDHQMDSTEHYTGSWDERVKRCKTSKAAASTQNSCRKTVGENIYLSSSYPCEVQCFVACRSVNCHCLAIPETPSHCKKANAKFSSCSKPADKVLLEFEQDSFCKFQVWRVPCLYYLISKGICIL